MTATVECEVCGSTTDNIEWTKACHEGCPICGSHKVAIYGGSDE